MKPPVCRVCGVEHWLTDGHVWPKEAAAKPDVLTVDRGQMLTVDKPVTVNKGVVLTVNREQELLARIAELEAEVARLKPDRKAYMREYQRRQRAGKKHGG